MNVSGMEIICLIFCFLFEIWANNNREKAKKNFPVVLRHLHLPSDPVFIFYRKLDVWVCMRIALEVKAKMKNRSCIFDFG